jgi:hypothetical protein
MKKNAQIIAWVSYLLSVLFLLIAIVLPQKRELFFLIYALIQFVPWIICIVNSLKQKPLSLIWPIFLFIGGLIAIPIYLIWIQRNNKSFAY